MEGPTAIPKLMLIFVLKVIYVIIFYAYPKKKEKQICKD